MWGEGRQGGLAEAGGCQVEIYRLTLRAERTHFRKEKSRKMTNREDSLKKKRNKYKLTKRKYGIERGKSRREKSAETVIKRVREQLN